MILSRVIDLTQLVILVYFTLLNITYTTLTLIAFFDLLAYRRRIWRGSVTANLSESSYKPVSILVPAFNEQETLIATIRSLITLNYPEFEVVVINDGSTDDTLARVRKAFSLYPLPSATRVRLKTEPVRATYRSLDHANLLVIDKENGGKSDSLNAGINASSYPLFCCMDADSLLESDALLRVSRAFAEDERIVAAGGIIRTMNGSVTEDGQIIHIRTPSNPLVLCQALEYIRGFLAGRTPLAKLNSLLIISGAFGLFRKETVIAAGGYHTGTVCEDMELVVRLHRRSREKNGARQKVDEVNAGRVIFVPDPVCWTQVPSDWRSLLRQRDRWHRGLLESLWLHRKMLLNPFYGRVGLFGMSYYVFVEALGPVVEVGGYLVVLILWMIGGLDASSALLFFCLAILAGIVHSLMALILDDLLFKRYERGTDLLKMVGAAFVEYLGYRQIVALQRTLAFVTVIFRRGHWGKVRRTKIPHSEKGMEAA